jgi:DNA-binding transcriptional ArsR family regulator
MMDGESKDTFQAEFCAERLKALADPMRLRIVRLLRYGEMAVSDIAEFLDAEIVSVSHHLQILKHADLITSRREGRYIYYRLGEDLLKAKRAGTQFLDLGCCRIEVSSQP